MVCTGNLIRGSLEIPPVYMPLHILYKCMAPIVIVSKNEDLLWIKAYLDTWGSGRLWFLSGPGLSTKQPFFLYTWISTVFNEIIKDGKWYDLHHFMKSILLQVFKLEWLSRRIRFLFKVQILDNFTYILVKKNGWLQGLKISVHGSNMSTVNHVWHPSQLAQ